MNSKIIYLVTLAAVSAILAVGCTDRGDRGDRGDDRGISIPEGIQENDMPGVKNLWILKKNNDDAWRIWDDRGNNMGVMMASAGDEITWHAFGSAMTFDIDEQDLDTYLVDEDGKFSGGTANLNSGETLRVTVREDAPKGRLVYDVYVEEADTTVVGSSPPVIIIY